MHVKFSGDLPTLRQGEYVAYFATITSSAGSDCNLYGFDTIGKRKPKHTAADWDPAIGREWPINETPRWCGGDWLAQALVEQKKSDGGYHPRRVFARKTFTVG